MSAPAIYDAEVWHRRLEPEHVVRHRLRLVYLDLAEIPDGFRRRDYFDGTDRPLGEAVADLVEERCGRRPDGPVRVLTQLRTLGWLFNPLTTYYCFEPDGRTLHAVVLEVTNTPWHERFWYVLPGDVLARGDAFPKQFHVSPLLPMDLSYRCRVEVPGERLGIQLELSSRSTDGSEERVLDVALTGQLLDADRRNARTALLRATQTMRVSAAIYANAALLRWRGAPFHHHPPRGVPAVHHEPRRTS